MSGNEDSLGGPPTSSSNSPYHSISVSVPPPSSRSSSSNQLAIAPNATLSREMTPGPGPVCTNDLEVLIRKLQDQNERDDTKLKVLQELWDSFDNFTSMSQYQTLMESLVRCFLKLFAETSAQFIAENNTQQLRKLMLEIILRTTGHEVMRHFSKQIQMHMMKIVQTDNEVNAVLAIKILIDHLKLSRVSSSEQVQVTNLLSYVRKSFTDMDMHVRTGRMFEQRNLNSTRPSAMAGEDLVIETSLQQCFMQHQLNLDTKNSGASNLMFQLIPRASQSVKVFGEIIHLIMLIYQQYKQAIVADFLIERIAVNQHLQIICNTFLVNAETCGRFGSILAQYLLKKLPEMAYSNARIDLYLKLFKLIFSAVSCTQGSSNATASQNVEKMIKPWLHQIVRDSMYYSLRGREPTNYFLLLRALFRSIGGGSQDVMSIYHEFLPLLPSLLSFLNRMQAGQHRMSMRELFVELCLTVGASSPTIPHAISTKFIREGAMRGLSLAYAVLPRGESIEGLRPDRVLEVAMEGVIEREKGMREAAEESIMEAHKLRPIPDEVIKTEVHKLLDSIEQTKELSNVNARLLCCLIKLNGILFDERCFSVLMSILRSWDERTRRSSADLKQRTTADVEAIESVLLLLPNIPKKPRRKITSSSGKMTESERAVIESIIGKEKKEDEKMDTDDGIGTSREMEKDRKKKEEAGGEKEMDASIRAILESRPDPSDFVPIIASLASTMYAAFCISRSTFFSSGALVEFLSAFPIRTPRFFLSSDSLSVPARRSLFKRVFEAEGAHALRHAAAQSPYLMRNMLKLQYLSPSSSNEPWTDTDFNRPLSPYDDKTMDHELLTVWMIDVWSRNDVDTYCRSAHPLVKTLQEIWRSDDFKTRYMVKTDEQSSSDYSPIRIQFMNTPKYEVPTLFASCFVRYLRGLVTASSKDPTSSRNPPYTRPTGQNKPARRFSSTAASTSAGGGGGMLISTRTRPLQPS